MTNRNPCATLTYSGIKLNKYCQSPKFDATLYRQLFNSLIYITHNQPNISFSIGVVSRIMEDTRESHWKSPKRIVHYIKGTFHLGIKYCCSSDLLVNFIDSNWACDSDDQKSTSGYVFHFIPGPLVWFCKKQNVVSLLTMEAKYHCTINAGTKYVWLH